MTGRHEVALEVHLDDRVPVVFREVDQDAVAEDAGVVHEYVEVTKSFDGGVDQTLTTLPVGDVVVVGNGFATHRLDFGHNLLGGRTFAARTIEVSTEVIDDHLGAFSGEEKSVLAANATSSASNNCYTTIKKSHDAPSN
ncbi:unannotated protein [freshwater metagenome]|uniref:Unannotated protein n=1 Tax=freshwater metagenome TaxID=449393 RepID=A0A6J6WPT6_9ZZZZ